MATEFYVSGYALHCDEEGNHYGRCTLIDAHGNEVVMSGPFVGANVYNEITENGLQVGDPFTVIIHPDAE